MLVTNGLRSDLKVSSTLMPLHHGLIVSCQATANTAIDTPAFIQAQALTVESAGAIAIRAQGIENVQAVVEAVKVPVIGLVKLFNEDSEVYITPRVEDVLALVEAGADIVAVDATQRTRLGGVSLEKFYSKIREHTKITLLADIDSLENAIFAQELGFDAIATTLNGYTNYPSDGLPNIDLISSISKIAQVPIIAEGGFSSPLQVKSAISNGAWAVCVGTAITNPYLLTKQFVAETL